MKKILCWGTFALAMTAISGCAADGYYGGAYYNQPYERGYGDSVHFRIDDRRHHGGYYKHRGHGHRGHGGFNHGGGGFSHGGGHRGGFHGGHRGGFHGGGHGGRR